jgi:hypothetical protein
LKVELFHLDPCRSSLTSYFEIFVSVTAYIFTARRKMADKIYYYLFEALLKVVL